jgi:thioredoxin-dependent peroxiredoxin
MSKITLKGNPIHTNGTLPLLHKNAPDFALVDLELKDRSLKDFKGKKKVLTINPSLDTEVCSLTAKKFNQESKNHPEAVFLVITADLPFAQKRFCGLEGLKNVIPLSMMRSKDFGKNYGILIVDGPLAGLLARAVVVIDENDQVIYTELVPEIAQEPNYDRVLEALQ